MRVGKRLRISPTRRDTCRHLRWDKEDKSVHAGVEGFALVPNKALGLGRFARRFRESMRSCPVLIDY